MLLVLTALTSFLGTNMDGFAVLVTLFAQADVDSDRKLAIHVCAGEFVGFTVICIISLIMSWIGTKFFSPGYVELIGIFPFVLGVWNMLLVFIEEEGYEEIPDTDVDAADDDADSLSSAFEHIECTWFLHAEVLEVAALVLACGADNVVLYSALFMSLRTLGGVASVLFIFYALLALLLFAAYHVVHLPAVHLWIRRRGRRAVPFLWMAIGLYILSGSVLASGLESIFA